MTNKVQQVRVAPVMSPLIVAERPQRPMFAVVNTYTKSFEENGETVWYLFLVMHDEQVYKYKLDFYES